jgi:hypothetical protein
MDEGTDHQSLNDPRIPANQRESLARHRNARVLRMNNVTETQHEMIRWEHDVTMEAQHVH